MTENFHLIRDEYGNSVGTDSALEKETPDFALAGEEKEKNNLYLQRSQIKVIQINKTGKL